jgi:geranylgeranyl diphosphate synthase type II
MNREMTPETFEERCDVERSAVESRCAELVTALAADHEGIAESISYSLLGGGKRLRPILCLWTHDLVGGRDREAALDAACAVECIHTYSLIHDDLPCMDDDDYRRGKLSSHKKFGEATAVLTGDALLTLAFGIVATIPDRHAIDRDQDVLAVAKLLASAAGTGGLITGQALDITEPGKRGSLETVRRIHQNKTARLLSAAMEVGAIIGNAEASVRGKIRRCGMLAGEAFQIIDDLLDLESDRDTLGKTPGKDIQSGKLTYPSVVGADEARAKATLLIEEAKTLLPVEGESVWVSSVMDFIVARVS